MQSLNYGDHNAARHFVTEAHATVNECGRFLRVAKLRVTLEAVVYLSKRKSDIYVTVLLSMRSAADVRDKITTMAAPPPIIEASR